MTFRSWLISSLLRLYPASWRKEYGEELEGVLQLRPFSPFVIVDVIFSAGLQRLRIMNPWKICGALLLIWSSFWITGNSIAPLSPATYGLYAQVQRPLWLLILFGAAFWTSMGGKESVWQIASASVKAAMVGILPDLTILALNVAGILPGVLLDVDVHHRNNLQDLLAAIVILPIVVLIAAQLVGLCGALAGGWLLRPEYSQSDS